MPTKEELRIHVKEHLGEAVASLNAALLGKGLRRFETVLGRLGRAQHLPHWYSNLLRDGTLPNLDGKTIGSVLEMLFVAVLEKDVLTGAFARQLRINPASGIDLPDLDLGVKTPSENFCTSEPFFSAYERLHGTEYDVVVMLTDYQTAKKSPPLRLSVIKFGYLTKTHVADSGLCAIARRQRERLIENNESRAKKVFRFLAHVNQSDWRAKKLLRLVDNLYDDTVLRAVIKGAEGDFIKTNTRRAEKNREPVPQQDLDALNAILRVSPLQIGVIDAVDNWVIETQGEFGRLPGENEWHRLKTGPLDGQIGMSFALQWRFNFGRVFANGAQCDA